MHMPGITAGLSGKHESKEHGKENSGYIHRTASDDEQ